MEETMPDVVTSPSETASRQKVAHARISEPVLVKGRREFFKYRDLGVADASADTSRANPVRQNRLALRSARSARLEGVGNGKAGCPPFETARSLPRAQSR